MYNEWGGEDQSRRHTEFTQEEVDRYLGPDTSPVMSRDDNIEAQERLRETGRENNTNYSYLNTMRNDETNVENLSEDSETDKKGEGEQKKCTSHRQSTHPHGLLKTRESQDNGKFSTSTPN